MAKITRHGGPTNNPPAAEVRVESERPPDLAERFRNGQVSNLPLFLDSLVTLGVLKQATAQGYLTAVGRVMGTAGNVAVDVRSIDLDSWCTAFAQNGGDLSEETRSTYQARFRKAVDLYRAWLDDPDRFFAEPGVRERDTLHLKLGEVIRAPHHGGHLVTTNYDALLEAVIKDLSETPDMVTYPFPLGDGRLARLALPHPLSRADAERLGAFVLSLAIDSEDAEPGRVGQD